MGKDSWDTNEVAGSSGDDAAHNGTSTKSMRKEDRVLLAIGPEGGWRAAEVHLLVREEGGGFTQVSLGDRIMSTTVALVSAVGTIQAAQQIQRAPSVEVGGSS